MLIIDAHLDLSWNALQWNRNLLDSVYTIRTKEAGVQGKGRANNTVAFPEMRQGKIALAFATMLARSTGLAAPYIDYGSIAQAYGVAYGQLAYYRALEADEQVRIITETRGLNDHIAEWQLWDSSGNNDAPPPLGFVLSMEGADPIQTPDQLQDWYDAGLRLLGPTHYGPGRYAGGTNTEIGFSDIGKELLKVMESIGMALDMTHLCDQAFWEAIDLYNGPLLASHQNCRALVPHQRQFSDEQIKVVIERGGVLGAAFDTWMLKPGWVRGQSSNADVFISHVVDHIDHLCQLAGNANHAAIGTDLDGGFGREQSPADLDTIADLQMIPAQLADRGYSRADIDKIMHGNWLRLLDEAWGGV